MAVLREVLFSFGTLPSYFFTSLSFTENFACYILLDRHYCHCCWRIRL